MPKYTKRIEVPGKSSKELFDVVSMEIEKFMNKLAIGKVGITREPQDYTIEIDSKMFSVSLVCMDGSIQLDGKMSMMAAPFRSKIDEGIDRWIQRLV